MTASYCFGCCSPYALGLFFILCVSLIWSAASILVQFLYTKQSFDSPFLLTYIGVSLFTLLLPTNFVIEQGKQMLSATFGRRRSLNDLVEIPTTTTFEIKSDERGQYENVPSVGESASLEEEQQQDTYQDEPDNSQDGEADNSVGSDVIGIPMPPTTLKWTNYDHMNAAVKIAPVWFIANWTYNASLAYTSITSSTVLASTGSVFTFLFAVLYRDEQFTCMKFLGVLLGVTGSLFTALHDANHHYHDDNDDMAMMAAMSMNNSTSIDGADVEREDAIPVFRMLLARRQLLAGPAYHTDWSQERALFGDALGLISALGYGAYAVMVRVLCPRDESLMSMEVLLGYIGLFNMVALSPILFYQLFNGNHSDLTWVVLGFLVVKGLLDNVLSDYLWARSVVLTSATVATVGLGLTIPLAFLSDVLWMAQDGAAVVSLTSVAGALSVLAGFILVNIAADDNNAKEGANDTADNPLQDDDFVQDNSSNSQPVPLTEMNKYSDEEEPSPES
ncbi:solute carrier family 35, member F5 [Seminavis robusta]|uniref:Solute carrier family 35, member F5 n=1 Tax=Seminavis robusta TaxID=568900 RepID=A0A9N8EJ58_9STRA|nr:solute carrier family 35, member F5 [Seminavis robusta]|eukprot:Sro1165_g248130.1 solute carrier family 35, member F5 (504) ;mRNA; r:23058-24569